MSYYSIPEKVNAATWFPNGAAGKVPATATIKDIQYMQEMNNTVCANSKDITDTVELEDVRDGNKYQVKVLADGKCWMVNNLQLDLSIIGIAAADASDHLSTDYPAEGLVDRFNTSITNAWVATNTLDEFSKAPAKMNGSGSTLLPDAGYFYSWCAATAKTCSSATAANADASGSICPKGWRLPSGKTGVDANDFAILAGLSTTNILEDSTYWSQIPNKSVTDSILTLNNSTWLLAGYVNTGGLRDGSVRGYYWTSTASSSSNARHIDAMSGSIAFAKSSARNLGFPLRCIADKTVLESQQISDRFAHTETKTVTGAVTVSVANTISIDAVSGTGNIDVDSTKIGIGTISATIISNTTYRVMLSAAKTSLTSSNPANTAEIPTSDNVVEGTNAWGIQNADGTTYTAITDEAHEYAHTHTENESGNLGKTHLFTVGISVAPTLPSDNYATDVTVTAVSF